MTDALQNQIIGRASGGAADRIAGQHRTGLQGQGVGAGSAKNYRTTAGNAGDRAGIGYRVSDATNNNAATAAIDRSTHLIGYRSAVDEIYAERSRR